ncbi:hypothetical protein M408DRAFT_333760 [Serendipita vermifera MAFF 305830]|uniref:Uncharacterized protein n=1 Tax=Serendipita vermifera MAFF 305830 TaxID=933852 RepID=A0A0C2W2R4_SERVB|nr:hypothetical protein M408DRAFT_333816 [Serendipita vermifera MAFF 305830]KIM20917.1 hypothetical protein M408DRAFT_333760 [Serendipita vermifera MAFF 305830]
MAYIGQTPTRVHSAQPFHPFIQANLNFFHWRTLATKPSRHFERASFGPLKDHQQK